MIVNKFPKAPPSIPLHFLRWFCHPELIEDVEGDLFELYDKRLLKSAKKARIWFWMDILLLFRPGIIRNLEFAHRYKSFKHDQKLSTFILEEAHET